MSSVSTTAQNMYVFASENSMLKVDETYTRRVGFWTNTSTIGKKQVNSKGAFIAIKSWMDRSAHLSFLENFHTLQTKN
ncbi:unnamed protein product [Allacma fusca]|uniref:Uncharacterized protein n=1 Tax=Allacma fusca TaxID=39272 RepID=A0A8J2JT28_9HEXA|nr:unnamed protein product [Allacma fusca]